MVLMMKDNSGVVSTIVSGSVTNDVLMHGITV